MGSRLVGSSGLWTHSGLVLVQLLLHAESRGRVQESDLTHKHTHKSSGIINVIKILSRKQSNKEGKKIFFLATHYLFLSVSLDDAESASIFI